MGTSASSPEAVEGPAEVVSYRQIDVSAYSPDGGKKRWGGHQKLATVHENCQGVYFLSEFSRMCL